MNILGISAYFHDSAAALVKDGTIVAAAQEERFTRIKHDATLPQNSIEYCLREGDVGPGELDCVAFYEKPLSSFHRILTTFLSVAPRGFKQFVSAMNVWGRRKLWIPYEIEALLRRLGHPMPKDVLFFEHHQSHAASAFFPSPFGSAAVLTIDAVGEWATSTIGIGRGRDLEVLHEMRFPHSVGLLYSAFTAFCGFRVNSGEYKLMGLAPYGRPTYEDRIKGEVVSIHDDGSIELNLDLFAFTHSDTMTNRRFETLFDGPPRKPESELTDREADLARSIQNVLGEIVVKMARHAHSLTGERRLCMAGGVALNCVANSRVLRETPFDDVWVQPAATDAGAALGAALAAWYTHYANERTVDGEHDAMAGSFLGPSFTAADVADYLTSVGARFTELDDPQARASRVANLLAEGKVVGAYSGRMEFGPRSLGNRSILADPRVPDMQSRVNLKIKNRESFRPFAPAVLEDRSADYFEFDRASPYMLFVADLRDAHRTTVPAVTHVDNSARLQTVSPTSGTELYAILKAFAAQTGCPVLVNTSFNVRGEPIVCSPQDAYRCFMDTAMDAAILETCLLLKSEQVSMLNGPNR